MVERNDVGSQGWLCGSVFFALVRNREQAGRVEGSRQRGALGAPTGDGLSQQGGGLRGIKYLKQRQPLPSKVRVATISRCNSAGSEEVERALIASAAEQGGGLDFEVKSAKAVRAAVAAAAAASVTHGQILTCSMKVSHWKLFNNNTTKA